MWKTIFFSGFFMTALLVSTTLHAQAVNPVINPNAIVIYLNPLNTNLSDSLQGVSVDVTVSLYNLLGQEVSKTSVHDENTITIPVINLSPGIYILRLMNENGNILTCRIILLK